MIDQLLVVVFALCAAIFAAVGIVVRQRATIDVPEEYGVSTVMLATLLRRPLWWAGTAAAVAGFVFQALALDNGSLIVVQPLLVSALLFALPLSARLAHRRVSRGAWLWALLLTVSLAIFILLAHPRVSDQVAPVPTIAVVAAVCSVVVLGAVVIAVRRKGWQRAVPLAVAVGVLFGLVAVLTKMLMHELDRHSVAEVLSTPLPYALVLLGVLATLLQQSAFHAGSLQTSVPTMLVIEPMAAVLLGVFLLGETLTANRWESVVLTVAVFAMTAATIALGRDEGAYEAELEATSRTA
ncbi:DMT family transporter [Mycobacterium sp. ITM-2016-00316]|uniref:DMT family transporter n=1 Tax=Mycobacterium sp. ITM-2016-00316 TaxID=2099695 RepID=UPI000CF8E01F|nr:DMT family transporter [Mycobacterium sp. ITM-2016-00316]WNG81876.1 DMT family transporter [Mycobacterium sp. ITM-2016-00316]